MPVSEQKYELFNAISDPASARVRKFIEGRGLLERVRFRNVYYPEVKADFDARGGSELPALWDGHALISGADAIIARLQSE